LEMNGNYRLEVKDGALETMTAFLRGLLEKGIVDALLVPRHTPTGDNVVQTLFTDPARLENVDPIAPVLPVNSAKLVSDLTETGAVGRLGAVLRSCEVRALIELVKLQQASLESVVLIGVDCLGTYEMNDYAELAASNGNLSSNLLAQAKEGHLVPHEGYQFRVACQMCEYPIPQGVDLALGLVGLGTATEILITASDEWAEKLELSPTEVPAARQEAVDALVAERTAERDRRFAEFRQRVADMPSLLAEFSRCIRCHNCMVACPMLLQGVHLPHGHFRPRLGAVLPLGQPQRLDSYAHRHPDLPVDAAQPHGLVLRGLWHVRERLPQ